MAEHHREPLSEEESARLKDEIAMEKYGKKFDELTDPQERMSVGGTLGGRRGGATRKEQMEEEGRTEEGKMAAYSEMGKMGGKKGGYSTGYAHDPEEKEKYTGSRESGQGEFD